MGRFYSGSFDRITSVSAGESDIFAITAPSTSKLRIVSASLSQSDREGEDQKHTVTVGFRRYTTAPTGGTTITPVPHSVGAAASGVTMTRNNTGAGGAPTTLLLRESWNTQAGWRYAPIPVEMLWVPPSGIIGLHLRPLFSSQQMVMSAYLTFEEID